MFNSGVEERPHCSVSACREPSIKRLYNGAPHCEHHYQEVIFGDLGEAFHIWHPPNEPSRRFRYLLGRVVDEGWWKVSGDSYLTKARIRDRAFDVSKTERGCTFNIVRHPGAFKNGYVSRRITQKWDADMGGKCVTLISTREFQEGDVDS
jgi:hypothetical protein